MKKLIENNMNIDTINKKRKKVLVISTTIMVLIIIIGVILLLLGNFYHYAFYFISPIFVIFGLYLLSITYTMKEYYNLQADIISYHLANRFKNVEVISIKNKFKEIDNFYNKDQIKRNGSFKLKIYNNEYLTINYNSIENNGLKKLIGRFNGRLVKFKNRFNYNNQVFVRNDFEETTRIVNYFKDNFKNINELVTTSKKYKSYSCLYNDKFDLKVVDILEEISEFNFVIIDEDFISIFYQDKNDKFEFKVQYTLNNNDLIDAKNSYYLLFKLIDKCEGR